MNNDMFLNAKKDESIDLNSLMTSMTQQTPNKEKKLSPLEELQQQKNTKGVVLSNKEIEDGKEKGPKPIQEHESKTESYKSALKEYDDAIEKRKAVILIKQPETSQEYTEMMSEIDAVEFDENGKAYYNFKKDKMVITSDNKPKYETVPDPDRIPRFTRIRTESDPEFNKNADKQFVEGYVEEKKDTVQSASSSSDVNTSNQVSEKKPETEEDRKSKTIQVIIDKTGYGSDFQFTDEEREKLTLANEIRVKEVQVLDINSIKIKRSDRSFQETIRAQQISNARTAICFPASGFKAHMNGLTYGELSDIALSMDTVSVDQYNKRLSVIYNHMVNVSSKPFESYEDFLKNFAYTDIPMALYGLCIATFPEVQSISLRCGKESCRRSFEYNYNTRSILNLKKCDQVFLDKMEELASAPASEYDNICNNSAVRNSKLIYLPYSGYYVEMGVISAYDFLYNFLPLMDEATFKDAFGDDINKIYAQNSLLLTTVKSVLVPSPNDDSYISYTNYKDMLDAIYYIKPEDIMIISSVMNKILRQYQPSFAFTNVVCPHCQNVSKEVEINMDDLVFQIQQRLISTEINVENIQGL